MLLVECELKNTEQYSSVCPISELLTMIFISLEQDEAFLFTICNVFTLIPFPEARQRVQVNIS